MNLIEFVHWETLLHYFLKAIHSYDYYAYANLFLTVFHKSRMLITWFRSAEEVTEQLQLFGYGVEMWNHWIHNRPSTPV